MSAILIAVLLFTITITVGMEGFFGRSHVLDAEEKTKSRALAEACIRVGLLKLAVNPAYTGSETIAVGGDSCDIRPVAILGGAYRIETQGVSRDAYTNIRIFAGPALFSISSWEELAAF